MVNAMLVSDSKALRSSFVKFQGSTVCILCSAVRCGRRPPISLITTPTAAAASSQCVGVRPRCMLAEALLRVPCTTS